MEKVNVDHKHGDHEPLGVTMLMMLTLSYLTANQSEECSRADPTVLLKHYETFHCSLRGGTQLWRHYPTVAPSVCQSWKTISFYLTQSLEI